MLTRSLLSGRQHGGFWHKKMHPYQMWVDDIFMASPFLAEYGKIYNDPTALDEAARQIVLMTKNTRDPKTPMITHILVTPIHGDATALTSI